MQKQGKIRTAVVGTGYLGKYHAEKYANLENSELIAVCDVDLNSATKIAQKYHCQALVDYRELIAQVDAVSIATPTQTHYDIGRFFLDNGIHVLMEKPITTTLEQADKLITLADSNKVVLQVGHLERFNPVIKYIEPQVEQVRFIESTRIAPFNPRGTDVNVILDLMIHDIDLIQYLVKSPVIDIRANGASVISDSADITNARIEFENGCVANVTASRVSFKNERKMRLFQSEGYMSLDLHNREVNIYRRGHYKKINKLTGMPDIKHDRKRFKKSDAICDEIIDFLNAIQSGTQPIVTGKAGRDALASAIQITQTLHNSKQWSLDCETT